MRIEFEDSVVLGETVYCCEAAGSYYVGVKLDQAIQSLSDLAGALDDLAQQPPDLIARRP
jgi:hypothetical protein